MNKTACNIPTRPIIWSIAGSDCSGGAGIQADVKTANALGCEICTLITANTVQNSRELIAVHPIEVETLQEQFECLLNDKPPLAIKIGLVANNTQLQWLVETLKKLKQNQPGLVIVFDPVMKASVGKTLIEEEIKQTLLDELLQLTNVITPNIPEASRLANDPNQTMSSEQWAIRILEKGCQTVLITGGHTEDPNSVIDECFGDDLHLKLSSPRIDTSYGHGSGCTFSTALASFLAQGYLLRDAFVQSKAFINKAFELSANHQGYYGALIQPSWPVESSCYPKIMNPLLSESNVSFKFPSLGVQNLGLYPIVDSIEWLETLLPMGVQIIQLRLKNKTEAELDSLIQQAVELSKNYSARLFINDYWQIAIKHGAYGVHLGQEDLMEANLYAIHNTGLHLGISTHGSYELKLAEKIQPSYIAIGAIFPTQTKEMTSQIQGLDNLQKLVNLNGDIPVVAIGGITLENASSVIKTGVNSIAMVSEITMSDNPEKVVKSFQLLFSKAINTTH